MDEIEKAAREGKPLTEAHIRAEGQRRKHDTEVRAEEERIMDDIQTEHDARRAKINREQMEKSTTCVKSTDPVTFKPVWSLWVDGVEILRLDPEAVEDLLAHGRESSMPPMFTWFLSWMEKLSKAREDASDEVFAGKAGVVPH